MANAPSTSTYILVDADVIDLPNSRTLYGNANQYQLQVVDGGPGGVVEIRPTLTLLSVTQMAIPGFVSFDGTNTVHPRILSSTSTLNITNANGSAGNPILDVIDNTSIQKVAVEINGSPAVGARSKLNFINGTNVTVNAVDNSGSDRIDITVSSNTISVNESVLLTSSTVGHTANLGVLTTGLLKITVAGGIATPSTAVSGTDYLLPNTYLNQFAALTPTNSSVLISNTGAWTVSPTGTTGQFLTVDGGGNIVWGSAGGAPINATYLCQTGTNLPASGINLGSTSARLGIGTTTPSCPLDISSILNLPAITMNVQQSGSPTAILNAFSGIGPADNFFAYNVARGNFGTPTAVQAGDFLARLQFAGFNGTGYSVGSTINVVAEQTFVNGGTAATKLDFKVANGVGAVNTALSIHSDGSLTSTTGQQVAGLLNQTGTVLDGGGAGIVQTLNGGAFSGADALTADMDNSTAGGGGGLFMKVHSGTGFVGPVINMAQTRGTRGVPAASQTNDALGTLRFFGFTNFVDAIGAVISATARESFAAFEGTSLDINLVPLGSNTLSLAASFRGDNGGVLLIGTSSEVTSPSTYQLQLGSTTGYNPTSTVWAISSDQRIKQNIVDVQESLPIIEALQPRKFQYTQERVDSIKESGNGYCSFTSSDVFYGFVAQEVQALVPEAIHQTTMKFGTVENILNLDIQPLTIILFKAVKELYAKVKTDEATIVSMQAQIAAIQAQVNALTPPA